MGWALLHQLLIKKSLTLPTAWSYGGIFSVEAPSSQMILTCVVEIKANKHNKQKTELTSLTVCDIHMCIYIHTQCVCVCVHKSSCVTLHMWGHQKKTCGCSLYPKFGFLSLKSNCQAQHQVSLPLSRLAYLGVLENWNYIHFHFSIFIVMNGGHQSIYMPSKHKQAVEHRRDRKEIHSEEKILMNGTEHYANQPNAKP